MAERALQARKRAVACSEHSRLLCCRHRIQGAAEPTGSRRSIGKSAAVQNLLAQMVGMASIHRRGGREHCKLPLGIQFLQRRECRMKGEEPVRSHRQSL
jgi:hypothetical protein